MLSFGVQSFALASVESSAIRRRMASTSLRQAASNAAAFFGSSARQRSAQPIAAGAHAISAAATTSDRRPLPRTDRTSSALRISPDERLHLAIASGPIDHGRTILRTGANVGAPLQQERRDRG